MIDAVRCLPVRPCTQTGAHRIYAAPHGGRCPYLDLPEAGGVAGTGGVAKG